MDLLDQYRHAIDQALLHSISYLLHPSSPLYPAAEYSLFPGGKRIRPLLAALVYSEYAPSQEIPWGVFCALEYLHTYSLIQDDLPSMDNDALRRNKPSLHCAFDEITALLLSDFFLSGAFELVLHSPLSPSIILSLSRTLAEANRKLLYGQWLDLHHHPVQHEIDLHKTAALFATSFLFGGICAEVKPKTLEALHEIGSLFGRLFQMLDDYVDQPNYDATPLELVYQQCLVLTEPIPSVQGLVSTLYQNSHV